MDAPTSATNMHGEDLDGTMDTAISSQSPSNSLLNDYLASLLPLLLSASHTDIRRSFLHASNATLIARFANEQQVQSVYINKVRDSKQPVSGSSVPSTPAADVDDEDRALDPTSGIPTEHATTRFKYTVTPTLSWHPDNVASLALIKRVPTIDSTRSIAEQIHVLNLFGPALTASGPSNPDKPVSVVDDEDGQATARAAAASSASPYSSLHSIVHLAVQPYFEAYISRKSTLAEDESENPHRETLSPSSSGNALSSKPLGGPLSAVTATAASISNKKAKHDNDLSSNTGIPIAKKKFAELELSLLHLQQNVEIPETVLGVHPVVMRAVEQARQMGIRPTPELIEPASLLTDSSFLNKIQSEVNSWIKEIQNVTKLSRDVSSGTASQEISFWLSMEKALEGIEEQLRSEPIMLTLDILKHAKRFHATVSFIADTGLKESTDIVHKYNLLMKDFPLNELLAATDLDKIQDALISVFNHLNKKLKLSPYPIRRALPLVEAISKDLSEQLLRVLNSQKLMYASFPTFDASLSQVANIFATWDDLIKEFTNVAREVTRKRSEKFLPIKINAYHIASGLKARIEYLRNFRKHHQQLVGMVSPTKGVVTASSAEVNHAFADDVGLSLLGGLDMQEEVRLAWEEVKNVDVLDTSEEGTQIWVTAETAYNERVARVENQIIARLRDRLGTARNASEMFRVFSRFNALFVRPKIRGAIQEYQNQLIESVKEDIQKLHKIFRVQYKHSEAYHMAQLRDLSPIAGAINWAKQIERQLNMYMKRVEDVLGKGWELYAEGAKLASESSSFRRKLDTRPIYEAWLHEINRRDLQISGRLFDVQRTRAAASHPNGMLVNGHTDAEVDDGFVYSLAINFDAQIITLFKEVRNLLWLGFSVPHAIGNVAKDAKRVYPHAVSLMETVRTYQQTINKVQENPGILPLVAEHRKDVQAMITRGMSLRWEFFVNAFDSRQQVAALLPGTPATNAATTNELAIREGRHGAFVRELASAVSMFQDRTDALLDVYSDTLKIVDSLSTCMYSEEAFVILLAKLQKTIDQLNLEGYANLDTWVKNLEADVERALLVRLEGIIDKWCIEFSRNVSEDSTIHTSQNHRQHDNPRVAGEAALQIESSKHEIRIKNQVIYLDPPVEAAKMSLYSQLQTWLGVVCHLPRLQSSHQEIGLRSTKPKVEAVSYIDLLAKLSPTTLERPFKIIETRTDELSNYVNKWLEFQALWDLESDYVYKQLGESLKGWQQLVLEIRKTRSTFDTSESHHDMGIAIINYEQVQAKVNLKYDSWQRDILSRFGGKLAAAMRESHARILKARHDLELHSIETSSTAQAVTLITFVQELKRKVTKWSPEIEVYAEGQKTLEKQRYQFPSDWLSIDQVLLEWTAFNDILNRKNNAIQEQIAGLQIKISAEDKIVQNKVAEVTAEWEQNKPIAGDLKADIAINSINVYDTRVSQLKEQVDMVARAKDALDMEVTKTANLSPIIEEIRDLKAVWTALSGVWAQIHELRESNWSTIQPRKLRQQLDSLLASTREMPSKMRQYAAFEYVQDLLRQLLKGNALISDLKSEALRERHWKQLFKALRVTSSYHPSLMTLGTVWDLDVKRSEGVIKEVIVQAQGEMALEEFLKQVKDTWSNYPLDLVNYQNKTRLIRGWDDLFSKCSENLNSLAAMKHSPYFKAFEEDASLWEDRLNRIHVLFDIWIDVQRQWVYLEWALIQRGIQARANQPAASVYRGIFASSADIKHLLPIESARFGNINSEFLTVMKKVSKSPFVLDVLNISGAQKSLERLAELLGKIQKALGEYLERERSSFPRFYFVGDEDLLEIIGNSKDVQRVMKHFKKMFAGISTVILEEDDGIVTITGMTSKEGEVVHFSQSIRPFEFPRINDWLARLENEMKVTLSDILMKAVPRLASLCQTGGEPVKEDILTWIDNLPSQLAVLALQINWTKQVDENLASHSGLQKCLDLVRSLLDKLAEAILGNLQPLLRNKCEGLITELVHERDVLRDLIQKGVQSNQSFDWLYHMRFYLDNSVENPLSRVVVRMADVQLPYGFEYLGTGDRLVQTPLTDKCYLTLTQALSKRLGGSPFGPAGTGKTESVKALGAQLGRFVLVFCCDENFDFQSMGRIFIGLCQVGAWGCFDEFNRLEERMLSAVSQQVQSIQLGLLAAMTDPEHEIELVGRRLKINPDTGIFITMNPGYAGRSQLPDNLKKLFRSIAMTKPDREMIAQVILLSQGYRTAEGLASKIVNFFSKCSECLSSQTHYDFGLRALKAVLTSAGYLKRLKLAQSPSDANTTPPVSEDPEASVLMQSVVETMIPKLIAQDVATLKLLLQDTFPGIQYQPSDMTQLRQHIEGLCREQNYLMDGDWLEKLIQLYQVQNIQHGLMMVGPSASGKTAAWRILLAALERLEGVEGVSYVIDPKAISKDQLYGTLDPTTREWNDGLFTHILRKIVDNIRGESHKRHWIIFDGDVDPEWVENLNSVLDDNKLLTLPNGERLSLPSNVRIMFEVDTLQYATLATVSRCGMVWFSEQTVSFQMLCHNYLEILRNVPLDVQEDGVISLDATEPFLLQTQRAAGRVLAPYFQEGSLVQQGLNQSRHGTHIMAFTEARALETLFSLLNKSVQNVMDHNSQHPDFPLTEEKMGSYIIKRMLVALVWAFMGDAPLQERADFGHYISKLANVDLPPLASGSSLIDYDVQIQTAEWYSWQSIVPTIDVETHAILSSDVVVPTVDTVRHEEVLYSWLSEHKPLMLCGPPGSGKTMTLFNALRKLPDLEVVGLNFSSATTPELLLKTFDQHCEYRKTPNGLVLMPIQTGKWIVLFCDEINLPSVDKYGTQRVISFLRQMVEHRGFWRAADKSWVKLERIQFVGACNPPTDAGRVTLSNRFLRHAPLVMVDYPGELSLNQIYGTFVRAVLKVVPPLRAYAQPLTFAMVDFYLASQQRFTTAAQAHYIYSPRELTRWIRGIYEALKPLDNLSVEGLLRVWAHEALRLFQDRLVSEDEKTLTDEMINSVAERHFPGVALDEALARPILFSNWTSRNYIPVDREELREFVKARLRVFYEEELDVPLVLFNAVLDHVLRIDRVFRQVQGHMLLIGVSGSGKTTLSRFVAWMNGLNVFQIKAHNRYTSEDFDDDLRTVLRRAGCKGEKICFIMDESNVLDAGFLERMNTLLANAEVPGLFEGDEYSGLMTACKEGAQRDGLLLDSPEELYRWFTQQVARNLHVVFTMNPPDEGLASRAATSPALFNRCVLDWFGDWSDQAFYQVATDFTKTLDLDIPDYVPSTTHFPVAYRSLLLPPTHRDAVNNAMVAIHQTVCKLNTRLAHTQGRKFYVTPRHYLDFISQYVRLFTEKRDELSDQQRHLNVGLDKLRNTVIQVADLRGSLHVKRNQLESKNAEANAKLQGMVADQREAEQQKAASLQIQAALDQQQKEIADRKALVMTDLAAAEPAVLDAQAAVSNIKKQHLTEVRSMGNPPEAVKMAMESVCSLLGHQIDSWRAVQGIIRRDDFIASIVNFDTEHQMTKRLREKMNVEYISRPSYNYENVNRASKACGPLVKWVLAQVGFSEILDRVGPLRDEVQFLEDQAASTEAQATTIYTMISELEDRINQFKEEYAVLISETQAIKTEMEKVQSKVERSVKLLASLESERDRWESGSTRFEEQMKTLAGNALVSAAFLAYAGAYDQQHRETLWQWWCDHMDAARILYKHDLSFVEYMSTAEERLEWQSKSLPIDQLCTENAVILQKFNRYPLVIDPTGQAVKFLTHQHRDRKISTTSFLDEAFYKNLESALRFGTSLLIQDVERLDPILNPVLNRELRRTGGRVLVRLGNQDIDFSPTFTLFLSTRDSSIDFSPDISSRVTFANFTMTRASLQSQSLSQVLRVERPDTEKKRTDLLKLQGEYQARLQHLEQALLQALNESSGNILDDEKVVDTLETLKLEASDITEKSKETETIMREVEAVTAQYAPLAAACSSIYFALDRLSAVNRYYQFSLRFFQDIFNYVLLHNPALLNISDPSTRLQILLDSLFLEVLRRASRALLHRDSPLLYLCLARIKLDKVGTPLEDEEVDFLESEAQSSPQIPVSPAVSALPFLSTEQGHAMSNLCKLPAFSDIPSLMGTEVEAWSAALVSPTPEVHLPELWPDSPGSISSFRTVLLMKALRPDRLLPAMSQFANRVFKTNLTEASEYDLSAVVISEIVSSTPVVMCSVPGYDASFRVDHIVEQQANIRCVSVAMGSQEGHALADQAIATATREGTWVLVKNAHLAVMWLKQLDKRLYGLSAHPKFRLFLTLEMNDSVPVSILRQSIVLMNEPPPGIRASLLDSLRGISNERLSASGPVERFRLYFNLAWLHALLVERLRYIPIGFSKVHEFNESDFDAALSTIDSWMLSVAKGRSNIDPASIPFDAIRVLLKQAIYGGRVDNEADQHIVDRFIDGIFIKQSYDHNFALVRPELPTDATVAAPDGVKLQDFIRWSHDLPEREPPTWLSLPRDADQMLATAEGQAMTRSLRLISSMNDDNETIAPL